MIGRVLEAMGGFYMVQTESGKLTCRLRGKQKKQSDGVVCGDFVDITQTDEQEGIIESRLPRKNVFQRPTVANIDQMLILAAHKDPEPDYLMLDRLMAICLFYDIKPVLCFNKEDLIKRESKHDRLNYYKDTRVRIFSISADNTASLKELRSIFKNQVTVFAGQSGVGKSTLTNALCDRSCQAVSSVSDKIRRGRHTTRHVTFFPMEGGFVADTPGFNALSFPKDMTPLILSRLYPEYIELTKACRYSNCLHVNEPDCAVKDSVKNETLSKKRYEHYLVLINELKKSMEDR